MKIVGHKAVRSPAEYLLRAEAKSTECRQLAGHIPTPGLFRFSTYGELDAFRVNRIAERGHARH